MINTSRASLQGATVNADVYSLDGKLLLHREAKLDALADEVTAAMRLDLAPLLGDTTVLVHLALHGADGKLVSENLYWRAASDAGYRALDAMAKANLGVTAKASGKSIAVELKNDGNVAALNIKLTVVDASGESEILPAFYSDNYISLLPGQRRDVTIDLPRADSARGVRLLMRGWNMAPVSKDVEQAR